MKPGMVLTVVRSWFGVVAGAAVIGSAAFLTAEYVHAVRVTSPEKALVESLKERARTDPAVHKTLLQPEFDVIAAVEDGHALVAAAEELDPDVIVTDITMPGLDGIAAASEILRKNPAARIVFVTVHDEAEMVKKGLAMGVLGYVLKLTAGEELVPAIHAALRGEHHVSPLAGKY